MANVMKGQEAKYIPWKEGMRITGKYQMPVNEYGEYLMRSGNNKHNTIRRKRLAKALN